jgi:hypothetical protein
LGNLATFHSPLGDRALYQTLDYDNVAAKGCIDSRFTAVGKSISQSVAGTGEFSPDRAGFDRIMLGLEG